MNKIRILIIIAVTLLGLSVGVAVTASLRGPTRTVVEPIEVSGPDQDGAAGTKKHSDGRKTRKTRPRSSSKGARGDGQRSSSQPNEGSSDGADPAPPPPPARAGDDDDFEDDDDIGDDSGDD